MLQSCVSSSKNLYFWHKPLTKILHVTIILSLLSVLSFAWAVSFSDEFLAKIEAEYGEYAKRRLNAWSKLSQENKELAEREKLEKVNNYFNLLFFQSDIAHWGQVDYWATPLEFIVSGSGDCEDYSIAKYFTLIELGVPDEKLMITYTKSLTYNEAHMVLTYYEKPGAIPLVLDNINKEILPASERKDLKPIYSFNGAGLWRAKSKGLGKKLGTPGDIKRWGDLESRMKEGQISKFN